jgi:hypothetical protein
MRFFEMHVGWLYEATENELQGAWENDFEKNDQGPQIY